MTLLEFIKTNRESRYSRNSWVEEEGFDGLYVRIRYRYINGVKVKCLDIANVHATVPGKGCFTKLVKRIDPELCIYVENILDTRFEHKLLKLGFILENRNITPPSYYLEPRKEQNEK